MQFERILYGGQEETGSVEVTIVASGPAPQLFEVIVVPMESPDISAEGI